MKLSAKILGVLAIIMVAVVTALTFVLAVGLLHAGGETEGGGADLVSAVEGGLSLVRGIFGLVGFILACIVGACLFIYLICFIISYTGLYKGRCNRDFIKYSAVVAALAAFFATVMFAFKPEGMWRLFSVLIIYAAVMVSYAAVALRYLKRAELYESKPEFKFYVEDMYNEKGA